MIISLVIHFIYIKLYRHTVRGDYKIIYLLLCLRDKIISLIFLNKEVDIKISFRNPNDCCNLEVSRQKKCEIIIVWPSTL